MKKVIAYLTRGDELLVFRHRDFPEAGLQVPAGTVPEGESPEEAVLRELKEESGLIDVKIVSLLGNYQYEMAPYRKEFHDRYVYHLELTGEASSTWLHYEKGDTTSPVDPPIAFQLFWMGLGDPDLNLAAGQGELLWKLGRKPSSGGQAI